MSKLLPIDELMMRIKYGTKEKPKNIKSPLIHYITMQGTGDPTYDAVTYYDNGIIHECGILSNDSNSTTTIDLHYNKSLEGDPFEIAKITEYNTDTYHLYNEVATFDNLAALNKNCPRALARQYRLDNPNLTKLGTIPTDSLLEHIYAIDLSNVTKTPISISDQISFAPNNFVWSYSIIMEYCDENNTSIASQDTYMYKNGKNIADCVTKPLDNVYNAVNRLTIKKPNDTDTPTHDTYTTTFKPVHTMTTLDPRYAEIGGSAYIVSTICKSNDEKPTKECDVPEVESPELC